VKSVRKLVARALRKGARMIDPPAETRAVEDEGVTWLSYAIPGMLDPGNIYWMDYAIRNLPGAGRILEIGSFCGLSTNVITHFKRLHGKRNPLITCDQWDFENTNGRRAPATCESRALESSLYCGSHRASHYSLTRDMVDLRGCNLRIPSTKRDEPKRFPLSDAAPPALKVRCNILPVKNLGA
jgi:hypothetical protein